jgi:hypothetical protein
MLKIGGFLLYLKNSYFALRLRWPSFLFLRWPLIVRNNCSYGGPVLEVYKPCFGCRDLVRDVIVELRCCLRVFAVGSILSGIVSGASGGY